MAIICLQLTAMDLDSTLQDLRLCAQETIILEER